MYVDDQGPKQMSILHRMSLIYLHYVWSPFNQWMFAQTIHNFLLLMLLIWCDHWSMISRIKTLFGNWQPHTADDHALCLFPPPIPLSTIYWQQHKYVLTYLSISRYTCLYKYFFGLSLCQKKLNSCHVLNWMWTSNIPKMFGFDQPILDFSSKN